MKNNKPIIDSHNFTTINLFAKGVKANVFNLVSDLFLIVKIKSCFHYNCSQIFCLLANMFGETYTMILFICLFKCNHHFVIICYSDKNVQNSQKECPVKK